VYFTLAHRLGFRYLPILLVSLAAKVSVAQSQPELIKPLLGEEIVPPSVAVFQMKQYLLERVPSLQVPQDAAQWSATANKARSHLLDDVVFHGWPKEWVESPPRFDDLAVIDTGKGYRLHKLRYEIVPGFYSAAILYEPERLQGKAPAVLNVNGHVGAPGKSVEYKQKRCINLAQHGILALNLEWFDFGELAQAENEHWFGAHLDLVGANALGLFYLEMRRGLDYLATHPLVDRERLGVTGLSGGGWQTLVLSALDERVKVSIPVAGFASMSTKIEARKYGDLGDLEQNGTDFLQSQDFTHLIALRAPRPTLLIYNAEDDCCFRGPMAKPLIFDAIKPLFKLYGQEGAFEWHENRDPGTHNYQLDNRLAAYRFFSQHFGLPVITGEIPAGAELKSYDELVVGLPKDNLTILGLARKMAVDIQREPIPSETTARDNWVASQRQALRTIVRYKETGLGRVWTLANTKSKGVETKSYVFVMNSGLSANGVWLKGIESPDNAPVTIVLNDRGKKAASAEVSDRVNRDEQVLALDLLFIGDAWKGAEPYSYAQILGATGDRALGQQAAQLVEITHWIKGRAGASHVRLEVTGIRNQLTALVAAALEPGLFSELVVHQGMSSLNYLLQAPVTFQEAPELFCLDFYRQFDLDRLAAMAPATKVTVERYVRPPLKQEAQDDQETDSLP
jgi:dienelactone hydrolase